MLGRFGEAQEKVAKKKMEFVHGIPASGGVLIIIASDVTHPGASLYYRLARSEEGLLAVRLGKRYLECLRKAQCRSQ